MKPECRRDFGTRLCGAKMKPVFSEGDAVIGYICSSGHVKGLHAWKRRTLCAECGCEMGGKHATGCGYEWERIQLSLTHASSLAYWAVTDEQWLQVQEIIEELLPFGNSQLGGAL